MARPFTSTIFLVGIVFWVSSAYYALATQRIEEQRRPAALLQSADSLLRTNQVEDAIKLYRRFLATPTPDTLERCLAVVGLGKGYLFKNRPDTALQLFVQAVDMLGPEMRDTALLAEAYSGIAIVHIQTKQLAIATSHLEKALGLLKRDDELRLKVLTNLGSVYLEQKHYENAQKKLDQALELSRKLGKASVEAVILTNLSNLYLSQQKWLPAEQYAEQSIALRRAYQLPVSAITFNNLGYANVQVGKLAEGISAYQMALTAASANERVQVLDNLQQAYVRQRDYESATRTLHQLVGLKDSLHQLNLEQKVAEINTIYETAEKQRQILTLQAENSARKMQLFYWIGGSAILLAFLLTIAWLRFKNLRTQQELERSAIRQQLLRAQLNPHFIFNALQNVQQYLYYHDAETSMEYLSSFSRLMRLILEHSEEEWVDLDEELEMLKHYLSLQKLAAEPAFEYTIEVDPAAEGMDIRLPAMLLQPFVENAVKHGAQGRAGAWIKVSVSCTDVGEELHLCVMDNGRGMRQTGSKTTNNVHKSMGTKVVAKRIDALNKQHRAIIRFEMEDASDHPDFPGTAVHLYIKLRRGLTVL